MRSRLEKIDSKLFHEVDEKQSGALVGGDGGATGTLNGTYSNGHFDGSADIDYAV